MGSDLTQDLANSRERGDVNHTLRSYFSRYGKTYKESPLFGNTVINTMDFENIQAIAALKANDYGVEPTRKFGTPRFTGDGVLSTDGAAWKHSRALIRPTFARREIADLDSLKMHTDRMLALLPRDSEPTDLQPLLKRLVRLYSTILRGGKGGICIDDIQFLDVCTEFLFGKSVDSLLPATPFDSQEFLAAFDQSLKGMVLRIQAGKIRFKYFFDKTWKRAYSKVHKFVDQHVERALQETSASREKGPLENNPTNYVLLREMAKQIRNKESLRYQIISVFIPARDATALLVSNTCFHLARHPDIWAKMRSIAVDLGDQVITYEMLKSLVYYKYVLFESLRFQPSVSRVHRTALRDTILPKKKKGGGGANGTSPIFVTTGTYLVSNLGALHHDKDIWGEDADEFKPSRWEGRITYWEFVPFYGGPRICPAQQQALVQSAYVLLRLAQEFGEMRNRDPELDYIEEMRMVTESRNGVKVALVRGT